MQNKLSRSNPSTVTNNLIEDIFGKDLPLPDPPNAFKFDVRISQGTSGRRLGMTCVSGLRPSAEPGELLLQRGAIDSYMLDWYQDYRKTYARREMIITVDQRVSFRVHGIEVLAFMYNDLDSGANTRLIESMKIKYQSIEVFYE